MTIAYKLTDQNMQTKGGCQWVLGEKKTTKKRETIIGEINTNGQYNSKQPTEIDPPLCSEYWLHFYTDPLLAILLNPIHANFTNPRLFEADCSGLFKDDKGLKVGYTEATLIKEIPLPTITSEQKIKFAILCTMEIHKDPNWTEWANNWLSGKDRSIAAARDAAARAAARAARAARAAADAAADAADAAYAELDLIAIAKKAID